MNDNNYQDKLNDLLTEKETIEKRLSKLIDMELDDDIDRKELFIQKEKELLEQLNTIKNRINHYEMLVDENKGLSKQLKAIDEYFDNFTELKTFNREAFENMIECIIVGDFDEDGNKLPRVARFVLKTGKEYKFEISNNSSDSNSDNTKNELVPFVPRELGQLYHPGHRARSHPQISVDQGAAGCLRADQVILDETSAQYNADIAALRRPSS